jgi:hypothetical protein
MNCGGQVRFRVLYLRELRLSRRAQRLRALDYVKSLAKQALKRMVKGDVHRSSETFVDQKVAASSQGSERKDDVGGDSGRS